jgi:hypothetical protein
LTYMPFRAHCFKDRLKALLRNIQPAEKNVVTTR